MKLAATFTPLLRYFFKTTSHRDTGLRGKFFLCVSEPLRPVTAKIRGV